MERKYTLEAQIVNDVLGEISKLDSSHPEREIIVAGGIAGQFYTPKFNSYWRPTMDIDLATTPYLNKTEFDSLANDFTKLIRNKRYGCSSGKAHNNYEIIVSNGTDTLIVHFDRFSEKYFEKVKPLEEKKVKDAVKKTIPKLTEFEVRIVRPEHYFNGKIKRLSRFSHQKMLSAENQEVYKAARTLDFDKLSHEKILNKLNDIVEERDILVAMPKEYDNFQKRLTNYKIEKDVYDICLFSKGIVTDEIKFSKDYMQDIFDIVEHVYGPSDPQTGLHDFVEDSGI